VILCTNESRSSRRKNAMDLLREREITGKIGQRLFRISMKN